MELPSTNEGGHFLVSILLFMFGVANFIIADIFASFSFEEFYVWCFRVMSLLSVTCVVLANWQKAGAQLKRFFGIS